MQRHLGMPCCIRGHPLNARGGWMFNRASCKVQLCEEDHLMLSNASGQNKEWDHFWTVGSSLMLYGAANTLGCWRLGIYTVILQTMKILNSRSWHHFLGQCCYDIQQQPSQQIQHCSSQIRILPSAISWTSVCFCSTLIVVMAGIYLVLLKNMNHTQEAEGILQQPRNSFKFWDWASGA